MQKLAATAAICALVLSGTLMLGAQAEKTPVVKEQPKPAAERPKEKSSTKLMRKKLAAAQDILEGLTTEDFEMIAKGAKLLKDLTGDADFQVSKDSLYVQHSMELRSLAEKLEKSAKDLNLDKASLHYVNLTMTCIECHRFVRDTLIAGK